MLKRVVSYLAFAFMALGVSSSGCGSSGGGGDADSGQGTSSSSSSGNSSSGSSSGSSSSSSSSGGGSTSGSSSGSTSGTSTSSSSGGTGSSGGKDASGDGSSSCTNGPCGTMPCDLRTSTCCVTQVATGTCIPHGQTCPASTAAFKCIKECDCPGGQVCCGFADSTLMKADTSCQTVSSAGLCPGMITTTSGFAQICEQTTECRNGKTCIKQSCMIGTGLQPAHLTMCGLQDQPPFNCTAI